MRFAGRFGLRVQYNASKRREQVVLLGTTLVGRCVAPASDIVAQFHRATVAFIKPGRIVRRRNRSERAGT